MPEWQYKVVNLDGRLMPALRGAETPVDEGVLNDLGEEGWELVDAIDGRAAGRTGAGTSTAALVFKRPTSGGGAAHTGAGRTGGST